MRKVMVCLFLAALASAAGAQSRGGRGRPGTGNPEEMFVPWKFLPKGADLVKGPLVVYWLPASLAEADHSPLRRSTALLEDTQRCVVLEIVAPDDAATIDKLGATGKLPMAVIMNEDGRVVRQINNTRPQAIEQMVAAELSARDDAVFRELAEAKKTKSVELYKKIWDDRCLYPLVGREAQRALKDLGVTVTEPPSTLAPDPNLKVTNPTTTRHR